MSEPTELETRTRQALQDDAGFQEATRIILGSILDAGALGAYTEFYSNNENSYIDLNDPDILNPMDALDDANAAKQNAIESVETAVKIARIAILGLINRDDQTAED